jgi:hypothetical protein
MAAKRGRRLLLVAALAACVSVAAASAAPSGVAGADASLADVLIPLGGVALSVVVYLVVAREQDKARLRRHTSGRGVEAVEKSAAMRATREAARAKESEEAEKSLRERRAGKEAEAKTREAQKEAEAEAEAEEAQKAEAASSSESEDEWVYDEHGNPVRVTPSDEDEEDEELEDEGARDGARPLPGSPAGREEEEEKEEEVEEGEEESEDSESAGSVSQPRASLARSIPPAVRESLLLRSSRGSGDGDSDKDASSSASDEEEEEEEGNGEEEHASPVMEGSQSSGRRDRSLWTRLRRRGVDPTRAHVPAVRDSLI